MVGWGEELKLGVVGWLGLGLGHGGGGGGDMFQAWAQG